MDPNENGNDDSLNNGNNNNNSEGSDDINENTQMGGKRKSKSNKMNTRKNRNAKNENMEGGAKVPAVGSKAQVWHGSAKHTSGGLTKKDLMKTKKGRIVSKTKHALGKKSLKNLRKAGYVAKKGTFKLFKK